MLARNFGQASIDVPENSFQANGSPLFKSLPQKSQARGYIKTQTSLKVLTLPQMYFHKSILQHLETAVQQL